MTYLLRISLALVVASAAWSRAAAPPPANQLEASDRSAARVGVLGFVPYRV